MSDPVQPMADAPSSSRRGFIRAAAGAAVGAVLANPTDLLPAAATPRPATPPPATDAVTPFHINVPDAAIADLKVRLTRVRFPEKETVADWSQGVPLSNARALVAHWRDRYDWRAFERRVNALPQFRTEIDGLGIHFLHIRSPHPDALPMIMTHGWPGSFAEFLKVIGPLTDPTAHGGAAADAFHLVLPSLPGFGFSDKPSATGWGVPRITRAWATLMARLGYGRWVAQGGDWGGGITHALARERPPGLVAAHVNWPLVYDGKPRSNPSPAEQAALAAMERFRRDGAGYFIEEATRPQTVGYALADSPVGQAMWIYEKFHAWTDHRGEPGDALTLDEMLDDISLYWFTDTAASAGRIYWESARGGPDFNGGRIDLPMTATVFPREIYRAPRVWAEQMWSDLRYWNEVDQGGHFAAFEQPAIFARELRNAFRGFRRG